MEAIAAYEKAICKCGIHASLLDDYENQDFSLETWKCPLCADLAVEARVQDEKDEFARKVRGENIRRSLPSDGRYQFVRHKGEVERVSSTSAPAS